MPKDLSERVVYIRTKSGLQCNRGTYIEYKEEPRTFLPRILTALMELTPVFIDAAKVKDITLTEDKVAEILKTTQEALKAQNDEFKKMMDQKSAEVATLAQEIQTMKQREQDLLQQVAQRQQSGGFDWLRLAEVALTAVPSILDAIRKMGKK